MWIEQILKKRKNIILFDSLIFIVVFLLCTGICFLLDAFHVSDLNFIIIYVLGVLITAVLTKGFLYSSLFSIISVLIYNFLFTIPRFTFHFNDRMYLVTFFLMFIVSILVSLITMQLKKRMQQIIALNFEKNKLKNDAEKEKLKATLLRSISHDLRTPLTTMKNGAEILKQNPRLDEKDKTEILNDIMAKSEWTIRLVENLLSLTRIDNEKLSVKKAKEVLDEVIPQAVSNVQGILEQRNIHYDISNEIIVVPMEATLIIQTLTNILTNAIQHTLPNGNIWMRVWTTGKNAVFQMINDGEAIREEDLPHIFEMYYTTSDCNRGNGIGLGLAICKLIISAHGGNISAFMTEEQRVVFEFTLPLEEKNGEHFNY